MPAINVNPMRPAAWGPLDFPFSGGMNPPCGKVCSANAWRAGARPAPAGKKTGLGPPERVTRPGSRNS